MEELYHIGMSIGLANYGVYCTFVLYVKTFLSDKVELDKGDDFLPLYLLNLTSD